MEQDYEVPNWLTEQFILDKILKSDAVNSKKSPSIALICSNVRHATKKGENFGSEMFRVSVTYSMDGNLSTRSFILKKDYGDESVNEFFGQYNLYGTEISYYRNLLPQLQQILSSAGKSSQLSPTFIYADDPVLVIEDMSPHHYRTMKAHERQDMEMAKFSLRKLAQLHAASMVHNRNSGGSLEKVKWRLFVVEEGFVKVLVSKLGLLVTEMGNWGEEFVDIIPKIRYIREHFYEIGRRYVIPSEGFGGCFIHGDAQLNNILLKFDSKEKPTDAQLIDLQIGSWSSPALDLLYFIFTSLKEDDYQDESRLNELIGHYYEEWSGILNALDYLPVPSLEELHQEIDSKFIHALYGGVLVKSLLNSVDNSTADASSVISNGDKEDLNFKEGRIFKEIKFVIHLMDKKGALDVICD